MKICNVCKNTFFPTRYEPLLGSFFGVYPSLSDSQGQPIIVLYYRYSVRVTRGRTTLKKLAQTFKMDVKTSETLNALNIYFRIELSIVIHICIIIQIFN